MTLIIHFQCYGLSVEAEQIIPWTMSHAVIRSASTRSISTFAAAISGIASLRCEFAAAGTARFLAFFAVAERAHGRAKKIIGDAIGIVPCTALDADAAALLSPGDQFGVAFPVDAF
jgi:hypothetical protein